MAPPSEEKPSTGFHTIKPASLELSARAEAPRADQPAPAGRGGTRLAWAGVAVLVVLAAIVIFVLPGSIEAPLVELRPEAPVTDPGAGTPAAPAPATPQSQPAGPAVTPWQTAQEAELRRQTQDVLAEMLDAQKILEKKGVQVWAGEEFKEAGGLADAGDAHYSKREFKEAYESYQGALKILSGLVERVEPLFERTMAEGNAALERGDSRKAKEAFDLALAIDALDRAAAHGRERVEKLDEVFALLKQGDDLAAAERLEEAQAAYRKATELDGELQAAKERLESVGVRITDRNFNEAMSAGFAALEAERLDDARGRFTEALRIKPGSKEAAVALEQARTRLRTTGIRRLLSEAQQLEADEQWAEAVKRYESVLKLDDSMSVAREGRDRAATRAGIHVQLEQILAEPDRLFDRDVFDEMTVVHRTLSALSNPGRRLSSQLAALAQALKRADTPVQVQLVSDNATTVTVYKVGDLGTFTTRELSLRPGRYIAVGKREGYQDVRREFFVKPDGPMAPVTIQADEGIALGS